MWTTLRNRSIAIAFAAFSLWLRLKHRLGGGLRLRHVDHVTIPVLDLEIARRFYCDVLGAVPIMTIDAAALRRFERPPAERDGDGVYHVSLCMGGHTRIDLFLQRDGQPDLERGHPHFAFRVSPGRMAAWKAHLAQRGIPTEGPLQLGFPGQASLYLNDPSGNHLEIVCHGHSGSIPIRPPDMRVLAWKTDHG